jgi:hypothetical protein
MSLEIQFGADWQHSQLIRKQHPKSRLRKRLNGNGARFNYLCIHHREGGAKISYFLNKIN